MTIEEFMKGKVYIGCYSMEQVISFFNELWDNGIKWNGSSQLDLYDERGNPRICGDISLIDYFDYHEGIWYRYGCDGIVFCDKNPEDLCSTASRLRDKVAYYDGIFGSDEDNEFETSNMLLDFLNDTKKGAYR